MFHTAICGLGLGLATDGLGLGTAVLDYKSGKNPATLLPLRYPNER